MKYLNYLSNLAIPLIIFIILLFGMVEKNKIFDDFLNGATEGMQIMCKIFPTFVGLFFAIGVLRSSGILDFIIKIIYPIIKLIGIPKEIMPLAILRPISRKCISCDWKRYYEIIWCGQQNWTYFCNNYGVYRNNFIYNSYVYKCCGNKKDKTCIACSSSGRHSWNFGFCRYL